MGDALVEAVCDDALAEGVATDDDACGTCASCIAWLTGTESLQPTSAALKVKTASDDQRYELRAEIIFSPVLRPLCWGLFSLGLKPVFRR
jgi:hypothetical protein